MVDVADKLAFTLMIVEDEDNVRNVFSEVLKRRFMNVVSAENGRKGLETYLRYNPDIIVTDINMPEMDGLTMCREIRTTNQAVPIIILSAYNDIKHLLLAEDIRVEAYVTKPLKKEELLAALDKAVSKAKLNKQ